MKITAVSGAILLGISGFSTAAGAEPAPGRGQQSFDWSGSYIGIHLGYGWGESDFVDDAYNGVGSYYPPVKWEVDTGGLMAGLSAGRNWHRNRMVFGIEGEIGYLNLSDQTLQPGLDPDDFPYDAYGTVDDDWYGGLSVRLGYALDRALLYVKVGAVYSASELGFLDTCTEAPCGNSMADATEKAGWGYQLGIGVERAVSDRWTFKAEYAHLDFGDTTIRGRGIGGGFDGMAYRILSDLTVQTVRVGVNYAF
jgi:outer membrane immunogenic protein